MTKRTFPAIQQGIQGWDGELADWKLNFDQFPFPVFNPTSHLEANLPNANENEDGIAAVDKNGVRTLAISDDSGWLFLATMGAVVANASGWSDSTAESDFNDLLTSLRDANVIDT